MISYVMYSMFFMFIAAIAYIKLDKPWFLIPMLLYFIYGLIAEHKEYKMRDEIEELKKDISHIKRNDG
ncbi:MAG: hypothetical protein MJZ20_11505 [Bacteroidaceae bacterium]|nr:hypothetical protein [Bacteroidaceae bacterium]